VRLRPTYNLGIFCRAAQTGCHPERSEGSAFHAASAPNNREENQNDMSRSSAHGFSRAKPAATDSGFIRCGNCGRTTAASNKQGLRGGAGLQSRH
jgi:hypothetical protein